MVIMVLPTYILDDGGHAMRCETFEFPIRAQELEDLEEGGDGEVVMTGLKCKVRIRQVGQFLTLTITGITVDKSLSEVVEKGLTGGMQTQHTRQE